MNMSTFYWLGIVWSIVVAEIAFNRIMYPWEGLFGILAVVGAAIMIKEYIDSKFEERRSRRK